MKVDYSKFKREFDWENWFGEVKATPHKTRLTALY